MSNDTNYRFRAARRNGVIEEGFIEGRDREQVSSVLAERGLYPIEISQTLKRDGGRVRLSHADVATGLQVLATLVEAGLPIRRALHALETLAPPAWERGLTRVQAKIREGATLAHALDSANLRLPAVVIGVVQAGEAAGMLAVALRAASDLVERQSATRSAVRSALAYPAILALAATGSIALLVGIVLPRFTAILDGFGQALPASTRLVMTAADVVRTSFLPGLAVGLAAATTWRIWTRTPAGRERWHGFLLTLPLVGTLRLSAGSARGAAALAVLLKSGVPIARALRDTGAAMGDAALAARLTAARMAVLGGQGIAASLASETAMSPSAVRLIQTGEQSGQLVEMLERAALMETQLIERRVRAMVRIIEPVLILIFGGLVALVAASLLQAVYSVGGQF